MQIGCDVKRRFHAWQSEGNKKPIATCRGDGFWIKNDQKLNDQPTPYGKRHHQVLRRMCAVDIGSVSPPSAASVNGASAKIGAGYFFAPVSRFFLHLRVNSTNRGVRPISS